MPRPAVAGGGGPHGGASGGERPGPWSLAGPGRRGQAGIVGWPPAGRGGESRHRWRDVRGGAVVSLVSRGFGRREQRGDERLPPGQYDTGDLFPVLSAGPTPQTPVTEWDLTLQGEVDGLRRWTWDEFRELPREAVSVDIHCVTKWSKFDTRWEGVAVDTLLADVQSEAEYALAFCDGGYTTNHRLSDLTDGRAWVVDTYDGRPLAPEHGGPVQIGRAHV